MVVTWWIVAYLTMQCLYRVTYVLWVNYDIGYKIPMLIFICKCYRSTVESEPTKDKSGN